jgi:hypothetical protein
MANDSLEELLKLYVEALDASTEEHESRHKHFEEACRCQSTNNLSTKSIMAFVERKYFQRLNSEDRRRKGPSVI